MSYISINTDVDIFIEDIVNSMTDETAIKVVNDLPSLTRDKIFKNVFGGESGTESFVELVKILDEDGLFPMLEKLADAAKAWGDEYVVLDAIKDLDEIFNRALGE